MPNDLLNVKDFAARIKGKHPEYAEVDDYELTQRVLAKYPDYRPTVKPYSLTGSEKLVGVQPDLIRHLESLQDQFDQEGISPEVRSGFRTAKHQNDLHVAGYPTKGNDGYINISPHQEGRALDIRFPKDQQDKGRRIINEYARAAGLFVPPDEPWHIALPKDYLQSSAPVRARPIAAPPVTEDLKIPSVSTKAEQSSLQPQTAPIEAQPGRTDEFAPYEDSAELARKQSQRIAIDEVSGQALRMNQTIREAPTLPTRRIRRPPTAAELVARANARTQARAQEESRLPTRNPYRFDQTPQEALGIRSSASYAPGFNPRSGKVEVAPIPRGQGMGAGDARREIARQDRSTGMAVGEMLRTENRIAPRASTGGADLRRIDDQAMQREKRLYEETKAKIISEQGGPESLERIKRDYAAVGRDAAAIDKRIEEDTQARVNDFRAREQRVATAERGETPPLGPLDKIRELGDNPTQVLPFISSAADITHLLRLGNAVRKVENGHATEDDLLLLREFDAQRKADSTIWYKLADTVSHLPAFIGEFASTAGVYTGAKKAAVEGLERLVTKKGLQKLESTLAGRVATKGATSLVGAAAQTVPAGLTRIPAGVLYREQTKGEDFPEALLKATGDQFIEIASERAGGLLSHIPVPQRLTAIRDALTARWLAKSPTRNMEGLQKVVERTGWHGVLGEMFEERVGDVARYSTGLQEAVIPTLEQLAVEGMAFSVPGAVNIGAGLIARSSTLNEGAKSATTLTPKGLEPTAEDRNIIPPQPGAPENANENVQEAQTLTPPKTSENITETITEPATLKDGSEITLTAGITPAGELAVKALSGNKEIAHAEFGPVGEGQHAARNVDVNKGFRGLGVATKMFDLAEKTGLKLRESTPEDFSGTGGMTEEGAAFWKSRPAKTTVKPGEPLEHPNPKIAGKPIIKVTDDGKAIVPNPDNKGGIPVVTPKPAESLDAQRPKETIPATPAEKPGEPHPVTGRKFSSTQVNFPAAEAKLQKQAAAAIPDSDLAADGREQDAHVTVKYGLHTDDAAELEKLLADEPPIKLTIGKVSIFPAKQGKEQRGGADYDVVKMDVDSADLHRLNAKISKALPVTDTHPEYKPHVTLAYVRPGEGAKYVGQTNALTGKEITLDKLLFSSKSGKEIEVSLKGKEVPENVQQQSTGLETTQPAAAEEAVQPRTAKPEEGARPVTQKAPASGEILDEESIVSPVDRSASQEEKARQLRELSDENVPIVEELLKKIRADVGLEGKWSHKLPERIVGKANRPTIKAIKPWHDVEHVRDSLRFKAPIGTFEQFEQIGKLLAADPRVEIVKVDTSKMLNPKEWGWRFAGYDLRLPNGQLVEFYSPVEELDAKDTKGKNHLLFEKWRDQTPEYITEHKIEYFKDVLESEERYAEGWSRALQRMGMDEAAARAAWMKVEASLGSLTRSKLSLRSSGMTMPGDQLPAESRTIEPPDKSSAAGSVEPTSTRPSSDLVTKNIQSTSTDIIRQEGPSVPAKPVETRVDSEPESAENAINETVTVREPAIRVPRVPASPPVAGKATRVKIPGTSRAYESRYVVREAEDVIPSHNPFNFQPDPEYHYINDRRYDREQQYQKQVIDRSKSTGDEAFDPAYVINNSPTAENGPPIIDSDGNVLGGNSRAMIIKRVYGSDDNAARRAYRGALIEQAPVFGLDSGKLAAMKRPVLVREIIDEQLVNNTDVQKAITELNVTGTTPLTQEERSTVASQQISDDAARFITDMIELEGEDATIASTMANKGVEIVNRLVDDGIFTAGERNQLIRDGKTTAEARSRVENILVGGLYRDLAQMQATPPGVRRNIERIVVPIRRVAGTDWDISEDLKGAIDAVIEARATGLGQDFQKLKAQSSMVREPFTEKEIALAQILVLGPSKTAKRFKGYAHDYEESQIGQNLFGEPPSQEDSEDFLLSDRQVSLRAPGDKAFARATPPKAGQKAGKPDPFSHWFGDPKVEPKPMKQMGLFGEVDEAPKQEETGANELPQGTGSATGAEAVEPVGREGTRALGEASAESVSGPAGERGPGGSAIAGPGQGERDVRAAGESGDGSILSGRAGDEGISVPSSGERADTQPGGITEPVDHTVAAADSAASEPQTDEQIIEGAESRAEENNPDSGKSHALSLAGDFFVEDIDSFSSGSLKQKYQRNIDAIVTLRRIQSDGREHATPEEQATMARFIGWGQFPGLFNEHTEAGRQWNEERQALKALLSAEEFRSARGSILNAHYTAPQIVNAMWDIARRLGFKRGRVVEPAVGSGNFFALMPRDLRSHSPIVGIELDKTTGAIAQLLYPNADIQVKGFEEYAVSDDFFDLAISNFPFGDYQVADPRYPQKLKSQIHDYFFVKSLDKVRPGGLVIGITSTGTMDKASEAVRRHLAEHADLVAAIRLPSNTFLKEAGTAVVTDIVILRKRIPGETVTPELAKIRENKWIELKEVPDPLGHDPIPVNEYFADHPEMIIGRLDRSGELYREHQKGVTRQDDFEDHFATAISSLPQGMIRSRKSTSKAFEPQLLTAPDEVKQGSFTVQGGKVYQRVGAHLVEQSVSAETAQRITGMIGVRDVLNRLFHAELHEPDTASEIRKELNKVYDAFVKKHGHISDPANLKPFADDPDRYRLLALEKLDSETKKVTKRDIFTKPTLARFEPATSAKGLGDAVSISLNERGAIDLERIGDLLGMTAVQAGEDLVKQGIAFNDPRGGWVSRGEYLTGRVRQKLLEASEAARTDPSFKPNVEALEAAQPEDRPYSKIQARLGATWIPPTDVARFMADQMSASPGDFSVHYSQTAGAWAVSFSEGGRRLIGTQKNREELGTPDKSFPEIVEAAITDRPIQIRRTNSDGTTWLDRKATAAATQRVKKVRKLFERWIWQDDERREQLHRKYNDLYNDTIPLRIDGSHQTFPGMNPIIAEEWASGTRKHQPNAVYRSVTRGVALLAHEVGTGKTFSMIATGMERRRLGLSRKPAIACLNSNVAQFTDAAHFLYPNARILAAHEGMSADKRQKTVTQIATGDWDLVILTHDNLDLIPMSAETQERFIRKELEELEAAVHAARQASGGEKDKAGNRIVKALEKKLKDREAALKNIIEKPKDTAITFEETGVDFLMVDEAHKFKALPVYTARGSVKGIPGSKSDRATNMYMRTQWLLERNNNQGVVFATGTPISNTMAELFNMQRYLQRADLEVRGVDKFDGWAAVFGETTAKHEFKPTGQWEVTTRFNRFTNLPQLAQLAGEVIDVAFAKDIPGINRPDRNDQVVTVPMSADQRAYLEVIRARARDLGQMKGPPQKGDDNWLVLFNDAKKAAIDMRLIDRDYEDDPDSKLNRMVADTLEFAKANKGKTQLIFSDMGVNPSPAGISLYADIIKKLVKGGIKRDQIIDFSKFTPGSKADQKAKAEGMERLLTGKAKVGIGGTEKLGTGVNVQKKLAVLRHLDAPPRPSDIEQRDGRGWRDGNENAEVEIVRYTTEGSFDTNAWQVLDGKNTFIRQFLEAMKTGLGVPETFEDQDDEFNYARVMAVTSGNPLLMKKMEAERELSELESDFEVFQDSQLRMRDKTGRWRREIDWQRERMKLAEQDLPTYKASLDEPWSVTIDGQKYKRDLEEEKVAAEKEEQVREQQKQFSQEKKDLKLIVNALKAQAKEKGLKSGKETTAYIQEQQPKIVARLKELGDEEAEIEPPPTKIGTATKAFRKSIKSHIDAIENNWNLKRRMSDEGISEPFAKYRGFNVALIERESTSGFGEQQTVKKDYIPVLIGPSGHHYTVNWAMAKPGAVFDYLDRDLARLETTLEHAKAEIADNERLIAEAAPMLDQPFPDHEALEAKRREVDVLTQQITTSGGKLPLPEDYSDLSSRYLDTGKLKEGEAPIETLGEDEEWATNTVDGKPAFTSPGRDFILLGEPTGPHSVGHSPGVMKRIFEDASMKGDRVAPFAIEDLTETVLFSDGVRLQLGHLDLILDHYPNARFFFASTGDYGQATLSIADGKNLVGVVDVKRPKPLDGELQAAAKMALQRAASKDATMAEAEAVIRPMRGPARRAERPRLSAEAAMGESAPMAARRTPQGQGLFKSPIEERFAGFPFLRSLFSPKSRNVGVNVPPTASDFAEVEERWKAAKGIKVPGGLKKTLEAVRGLGRSFYRHYIHLDPNKDDQTALTTDILRLHEASPAWAKAIAYDHLVEITGELNDQAMDVFTRNIVLPDILKDVEEGLYDVEGTLRELPFGYKTKEQVEQDLEKFQRLAEATPAIKEALDRRKRITGGITRRLVDLDLLNPDVLKDDRYYHRQVMKYVNAQDFVSIGTGGGVRLSRKGFQKERAGGGDFNVRYQEAEFEWLAQAFSLIAKRETLDQLDAANNIVDDLKRQAKTLNVDALAQRFGFEEPDEIKRARSAIGRANAELKDMAQAGNLSSANGRFDDLINELANTPNKQPFTHPQWFAFLSHLMENDLDGKLQAAMIFKAIAEREKFMKEELGKQFKTWQDLVPDTHIEWQPEKGNIFFLAPTVEEKALGRILAGDKALEQEDVRNQLVMGGRKKQWVIPKEVAQTLEDMRALPSQDPVENLWVMGQNTWKQWVLLSPARVMIYNLNNISGDVDIALAVEPRVLKEFHRAAADLWRDQISGKTSANLKAEIQEALKLGVLQTGLTVQEIPDINKAGAFRALVADEEGLIARGVQQYWNSVKSFTTWRENIVRLAAYRYALQQWESGKPFYAVSKREQVDALPDAKRKAAKVAREWIGDYGNISVAGQWLRRHMIPFYSWTEINTPRYIQLLRNVATEARDERLIEMKKVSKKGEPDRYEPQTDHTRLWAALRVSAIGAKKVAKLYLFSHILLGLISLWNHLMFPDEEEELRREGRKPHIVLGRADDGSIRTLKFQGALADALEWFALEDYPSDIKDLVTGRKDWQDKAAETVKAPAERLVNSLEPFSKSTFELATGRQLYPHFFREGKSFEFAARPIRDRGEYLSRVFSVSALYKRITDKPVRPIAKDPVWGSLESFLIYRTDPGEAAYWEIRGRLGEWQEKRGKVQMTSDPTERGNALYYFKQASKWGDDAAAVKWLKRYRDLGGTDKGLTSSIRTAHPLGSLARKDWEEFAQTLTPEEKLMLKQSIDWYKKTYGDVPAEDSEGTLQDAIDRAMEGARGGNRRVGPRPPTPPGMRRGQFGDFEIPTSTPTPAPP